MTIQQLREQRKELATQARALLDANKGDAWDETINAQYEELSAKIERLDTQIKAEQRQLDIEAANLNEIDGRANRDGISRDEANARIERSNQVYANWLRFGEARMSADDRQFLADQQREISNTMSTTTPSEGGVLVPRENSGIMLEEMAAFGGMRELSTIRQTDTGVPIDWPTVDETSVKGRRLAENAPVNRVDPSFATKAINAWKYTSEDVAVPFELLQDASTDIVADINRLLADRVFRITNEEFTTYAGANGPVGIVGASNQGAQAALAGAIGTDDLYDLEHSVNRAYRRGNGVGFMFTDLTLKAMKKLKDTQGRPLWVPGIATSEPDTINGYQFVVNDDMAEIGTGNISMLFGALRNYLIRDVMNVTLFRMEDSGFTRNGQVGFLAMSRHDGNLMDAAGNSVKHLVHP